MEKHSETIDAITRFLFIGKEEAELKETYELVIFLGNDDIEGNANVIAHLFKTGHITSGSKVILSGNVGLLNQGKTPEAVRLFEAVKERGLPEHIFILETQATNARENLEFSRPLAEAIKPLDEFDGILCIGRAFMSRRAIMGAAACNYPTDKMDYFGTVDKQGLNISPEDWWKTERSQSRVLQELRRISEYTLKGDLSLY